MPQLDSASQGQSGLAKLTLLAVAAGVTALALAVRLPQIHESLWLDELHTAWSVEGALAELPRRAAMGNNSPLYFLLPWGATRAFGMSEWALRLPSLIAGTALVPLLFCITRRWTESTACGLLAAFLAAIEPNFVFFSLEARPYALVQLLGLLQMFTFWNVLQNPRWKSRALWIVLSAALFYTHYTSVLLLLGEAVFLLYMQVLAHWRSSYRVLHFLIDVGLVGLLALAAAPHLWEIAQRRENWWLFVPVPRFIDGFTMLPMYAFPAVVACFVYLRALIRRRPLPPLLQRLRYLILMTCAVTLIVMFVPYMTTRYGIAALWMRRYMMAASTAPLLMAALMCGLAEQRLLRRGACLATAVIALLWTVPPWEWHTGQAVHTRRQEDWRGAIALVARDEQTRDWPVLVRSGLIEADGLLDAPDDARLREYSLLPIRSIYSLDDQRLEVPLPASQPGKLRAKDIAALADAEGVWLITPGSHRTASGTLDQIEQTLRQNGLAPAETETYRFGSVWVSEIPFKK